MKILITSGHLENFSGSKQWTYTVAKELHKDHNVTVTSHRCGKMADKIAELGIRIRVIKDLIEMGEIFDFGIIAQIQTAEVVRHKICKKTIYVSHGLGNSDKPLWDCDRVVAVSEEVATHHGIKEVIYNPIDVDWYNCPKNVLYISNHGGLSGMLTKVCEELGYPYRRASVAWNLKEHIDWADIVIAVGRGALEAMSCGKQVIIADYRKYNGKPLRDYGYNVSHNCSGRCDRADVTEQSLRELLLGPRGTILRYHDVGKICQKLLE